MSAAVHLPKKRRYLPPLSYDLPSPPAEDIQRTSPTCQPDSRTSPVHFNSAGADYYPIRVKGEMDLRVARDFHVVSF